LYSEETEKRMLNVRRQETKQDGFILLMHI